MYRIGAKKDAFVCVFFRPPGAFYGADTQASYWDKKKGAWCQTKLFTCLFLLLLYLYPGYLQASQHLFWPLHAIKTCWTVAFSCSNTARHTSDRSLLSFHLSAASSPTLAHVFLFPHFSSLLLRHTVLHVSAWRCGRWERGSEICLRASYWLILTSATVSALCCFCRKRAEGISVLAN